MEKYTHSWDGIEPFIEGLGKMNPSSSCNQSKEAESSPTVTDVGENGGQPPEDTSKEDAINFPTKSVSSSCTLPSSRSTRTTNLPIDSKAGFKA